MKRRAVVLCLCAAACGGQLEPIVCDGGTCETQAFWRKTFQTTVNREVDVLFVVDDTPAIAPFAATLSTGFADMARVLETARLPGPMLGPLSMHVGFVRAGGCDASTRGAVCAVAAPEQFLRSEWCATATNFSGAFGDAFACLADLGAADCGPAQPLAAAAAALTAPRPGWEGFLRPAAYLLVVVIAAGDDASAGSVSDLAAAIRGVKGYPDQTAASVIVPATCAAAVPPRLVDFAQRFGASGTALDLCTGPLAPALRVVTESISTILEPPCVRNVRDTDLAAPGLQADCTFVDHVRAANGLSIDSYLPNCDSGPTPCWRLVPSSACGQGYVVDIERAPDWCDEAGQNVTIECLGCADANDPACAPQTP